MHAFTGSLVWVEQNVDLSLEHRAVISPIVIDL